MIRLLLSTVLLLALGMAATAQVQDVTIQQIQTVSAADLAAGTLTSPLVGDTVRFVGVALSATVANRATGDFRPILTAGRRYVNYIQDTTGALFGGIVVLADNDTIARETLFDRIDSGDVVRITGVVQQFPTTPNGANQVVITRSSEVEILYHARRPDPIPVTIADFYKLSGAAQTPQYETGHRYAGMLVEINDVTVKSISVPTSGNAAGRVTMILVDDAGNEIRMRDQSGYFLARLAAARLEYFGPEALEHLAFVDTTDYWQFGYGTFYPPAVGSRIAKIVGAIAANTASGQTVPFMITPMYPDDLVVGSVADELASIFSVRRGIGFPSPTDQVPVTFVAHAGDNPINDAQVRIGYRIGDGTTFGATQYVAATRTSDSSFSAMLPAQTAGSYVTYWVEVPDNEAQTALSPRDTATYKYFYRVFAPGETVTIRDLQYTPNLSGTSGFAGFETTVSGTVTADTSDIPGDRGEDPLVVIQDGRAPWSGIAIRATGTNGEIIPEVAALRRGDSVSITAIVRENFDVTMLTDASRVVVHGTAPIPDAVGLSTADIGQKQDNRTQDAEKYESMLISYSDVVVTAESADGTSNFGEFLIADAELGNDPAAQTRVETDNSHARYTTRTPESGEIPVFVGMRPALVRGILYYSFNNYKLIPRTIEDYVVFDGVRAEDVIDGLTVSITPNPARRAASLVLTSGRAIDARVELLDALGARVAVLSNGTLDRDARIALPLDGLAAGAYFVRVTTAAGSVVSRIVVAR
jgi:hypothetical protein